MEFFEDFALKSRETNTNSGVRAFVILFPEGRWLL